MPDALARSLLGGYPQRRYNALLGEWVLVSPQRTQRPWHGKTEPIKQAEGRSYDPNCYLCPGNQRAGGQRNPDYNSTYAFTNDFPSLVPEVPAFAGASHTLLRWESASGTCRVICFSPRHDLTLAKMSPASVRTVIDLWSAQVEELSAIYRWVQLFENKGELMGCSNPHPHGQVWATSALPTLAEREGHQQSAHFSAHGVPLLAEYAELETECAERIVVSSDHWLAVVPFWAVWPFETLILPRRHVGRLPNLAPTERDGLAHLLIRLLAKYDSLFGVPFPYSMGWHSAPTDGSPHAEWQLHAHVYPPLLRSATVKKFMVGYEMLAEAQRDLTPEQAAEQLRVLPETLDD